MGGVASNRSLLEESDSLGSWGSRFLGRDAMYILFVVVGACD